ncbi:helix-turn-helix transcriptional regulator [Nocardioides sp. SOB77]|uniref:Helix-turn-helix transcriptional regulator n=1 Tax=Nocardioides oceani TaxID=3058369 RepID=A0ABT8FCP1_9ACTN|nr:helix-turn-helix transcriptional regulator [Nocardioides oceani]MDN4172254.1 helix-turn-helix transcriptional regulator [Nocardioides oceani]
MPYPYRAPKLHALGIEVARLRHKKGWSIDRLAEESGVGRRTTNLEGAIKTPRIDTLYAVAVALDVRLAELVDVL